MQSDDALLAAQHHDMELGIAGLVDGSGSRVEFRDAVLLLRKHIYVEETALFPVIDRDRARWMALAQMRFEHGDMWPHIESALALLEARADLETMLDDATAMQRLLQRHDRKEEEAIYAVADRYAADGGQPPLAGLFATMTIPDGWRCLRAPDACGDPGDRPVA